jgi:hypothetical protein
MMSAYDSGCGSTSDKGEAKGEAVLEAVETPLLAERSSSVFGGTGACERQGFFYSIHRRCFEYSVQLVLGQVMAYE